MAEARGQLAPELFQAPEISAAIAAIAALGHAPVPGRRDGSPERSVMALKRCLNGLENHLQRACNGYNMLQVQVELQSKWCNPSNFSGITISSAVSYYLM